MTANALMATEWYLIKMPYEKGMTRRMIRSYANAPEAAVLEDMTATESEHLQVMIGECEGGIESMLVTTMMIGDDCNCQGLKLL